MSSSSRHFGEPGRSVHRPVLVREVIGYLDLEPGLVVVDATVGAGGHSREILKHIGSTGTLVGLDRDPMMLRLASSVLTDPRCHLRKASYRELPSVLEELGIDRVDRVLLDLGLSSDQLADESRGFSFDAAGPLDLRFDPTSGQPAWKLLETLDVEQLEQLLRDNGQERFSREIAAAIAAQSRGDSPLSAAELAHSVREAVPAKFQKQSKTHPATRVFQALRIAVNHELEQLRLTLKDVLFDSLAPGGRAVAITFHSLEDKLVKDEFRRNNRWRNLTQKPVTASAVERRVNPRCRTAKLRAASKK